MLQAERYKMICTHVQQSGSALVAELSVMCRVSPETIRRDLRILEKNKKLIRSFGGAVALDTHETPVIDIKGGAYSLNNVDRAESFRKRTEKNPDIKMRIAKSALQFVHPGDCILLDNSSSCWFLARQIPDIEITVVTNSINIIQALASRDKVRIIGVGGEYSERHGDFHGPVAESMLRSFQINTFFFSCQGLNQENGVRDGNEVNARLKQVMLQVSNQKILLVDSSKFEQYAFCKICMLDEVDVLITNKVELKNHYGDNHTFKIIETEK
ncbi:DeoR/GlpR family DNA-binding transcription regulator [Brenneria sp. g21c3]|uniref:DeoR/GlpR family DNA-binding transcription regulator n=1 Tax=Brenneria sp. g21c3 TaxID=3093893 RepID=UPI002EB422A8|nr:DeoR/GlpR family DNA-binding transcription regulator [Brenneria sp. g21c3]